jgi:hypothetical protein
VIEGGVPSKGGEAVSLEWICCVLTAFAVV